MDSHVTNTYVLLATLELIKKELATVLMSAKSVLQVDFIRMLLANSEP